MCDMIIIKPISHKIDNTIEIIALVHRSYCVCVFSDKVDRRKKRRENQFDSLFHLTIKIDTAIGHILFMIVLDPQE